MDIEVTRDKRVLREKGAGGAPDVPSEVIDDDELLPNGEVSTANSPALSAVGE